MESSLNKIEYGHNLLRTEIKYWHLNKKEFKFDSKAVITYKITNFII